MAKKENPTVNGFNEIANNSKIAPEKEEIKVEKTNTTKAMIFWNSRQNFIDKNTIKRCYMRKKKI